MSQSKSPRRWSAIAPSVLLLAGLLGMVAANSGLRHMFAQAVATIDPLAVLAILPVQFVAILLCTAAQQALNVGIPFRSSLIARLVRDAAHSLLLFPPGLGDVVGARAVVLLGGRGRAAVALRALDILAEVIAELPFMALAAYVLYHWGHWGDHSGMQGAAPGAASSGASPWWGLLAVPPLAYAGWRIWRGSAHHRRFIQTRTGRRLRAEIHLMRRELARQRTGLPLAIILHFFAWSMAGVQVWIAAHMFGLNLSLFAAFAIESAATAARMILFFVPGGLVMQEAGAVLAGAAMGVAAPQALALSLILRLRELAFGLSLLMWPVLEYRARRRGDAVEG
ncbi:lysylphosphatidylglycerol synthase domain-containing protein [Novosphingobium sp. KACC 22771]|uniref:lysylphosphatidylglycerol synthase domain-containing protein n=1 Tax=Novosphingobium sp. KACC 22771 TaxID=3025670 RepID=UPI0023663558|nr:lysylphosphatidylglycerol synthase domain-containing protein [Novosphingobium sp. KACC 22771]WDF72990.1 lysylphosphatidylglycerol synthase domain-containing protein [Novosphingobium sp. KACC 22771]